MAQSLSPRILHASGFVLCVGALLIAVLFMERHLGLAPCPLCMLDRCVLVVMALVFLGAFAHNPAATGQRVYAGAGLALAATGIALAGRHIYLQSRPADPLAGCAPDLGHMLETLPFGETLSLVFNAPGQCADITWTFLGLSIPQQTLLLFIVLATLCIAWLKTAGRT